MSNLDGQEFGEERAKAMGRVPEMKILYDGDIIQYKGMRYIIGSTEIERLKTRLREQEEELTQRYNKRIDELIAVKEQAIKRVQKLTEDLQEERKQARDDEAIIKSQGKTITTLDGIIKELTKKTAEMTENLQKERKQAQDNNVAITDSRKKTSRLWSSLVAGLREQIKEKENTITSQAETISKYQILIRQRKIEADIDNAIIAERDKLMDEIPPCHTHGKRCVPHAIEWVKNQLLISNYNNNMQCSNSTHPKK